VELEQRLDIFATRGLPVTPEDLESDEFLEVYHSIKQSYQ
jgi:glutamine synthetase